MQVIMLKQYQLAITLVASGLFVTQVLCFNLQIEQFYSNSFVPRAIIVSYTVEHMEVINYNLTVKTHFPGKLLMHVFVRKLSDTPGVKGIELLRFKNLDFCKTLESLRNLTMEHMQAEAVMPSSFLLSCPLVPGFYFVEQGALDISLVPTRVEDGRYFVQLELIQVYEEVTKLLNMKLRCKKQTPAEEKTPEKEQKSKEGYSSEELDEATTSRADELDTQEATPTEASIEGQSSKEVDAEGQTEGEAEGEADKEAQGEAEGEMSAEEGLNNDYDNAGSTK